MPWILHLRQSGQRWPKNKQQFCSSNPDFWTSTNTAQEAGRLPDTWSVAKIFIRLPWIIHLWKFIHLQSLLCKVHSAGHNLLCLCYNICHCFIFFYVQAPQTGLGIFVSSGRLINEDGNKRIIRKNRLGSSSIGNRASSSIRIITVSYSKSWTTSLSWSVTHASS